MYEQPFNPFSKNLSLVKDHFKSGSVLALAIIKAVTAVMTVITSVVSAKYIYSFMINLLRQLDASYDIINIVHEQMSSSVASSISSTAPAVIIGLLIAVAFFIIYFKSRNDSPQATPKAGFSILYVLAVLNLIGAILISLVLVLCIVAVIIAAVEINNYLGGAYGAYRRLDLPFNIRGYYNMSTSAVTILAVVISIVLAVATFIILFYYINQVRYYSSVKNSITSVELLNNGAKPYGVMNIIFAIFSALNLLSLPGMYAAMDWLRIDSSSLIIIGSMLAVLQITAVVGLILEGRIAIGYAKHINNVKFGYNTHAPAAGPYSPFVAGSSANDYQSSANGASDYRGGYQEPSAFGASQQDNFYMNTPQSSPADNSYHAPQQSYAAPAGNDYADDYDSVASSPAPASGPAVCPECGTPTEPGAPFCGNCGTRLF